MFGINLIYYTNNINIVFAILVCLRLLPITGSIYDFFFLTFLADLGDVWDN